MLINLFLLYLTFACIQTLADWKRGPFFMVLAVVLQDPVRKMTPGVPGWLVLSTIPILGCMLISLHSILPTFGEVFLKGFPRIKKAGVLLLVMLIPAALISLSYGIVGILMLGLASLMYGIMLVCPMVGFFYGHDDGLLERLFRFYVLVTAVMLTGGVLELLNVYPSWLAIGTEAMGMDWIRHIPGFQIKLYAGFYRSPDVFGWHATMMTMMAITLLIQSDKWLTKVCWLVLSCWGLLGTILCGRRKFLYMLPVFGLVWLFMNRQRLAGHWFRIGAVCLLLLSMGAVAYHKMGFDEGLTLFYLSNLSDVGDRAVQHGAGAIFQTFRQVGYLGLGLGCSNQGMNHLARSANIRIWQEGGLSRFAVEFGLAGLIGFLCLAFAVIRELVCSTVPLARAIYKQDSFRVGILCILAGTVASFVVSGQIFNDPFVMFFSVFLLGVALSTESRCVMLLQADAQKPSDVQTDGCLDVSVNHL